MSGLAKPTEVLETGQRGIISHPRPPRPEPPWRERDMPPAVHSVSSSLLPVMCQAAHTQFQSRTMILI